jgi:ArsR family transcriptional regulator
VDNSSLPQEVTQLHADICSALADPRRILILYALSEKTLNVSDLADRVGISQPAASRHLKILRERGLVRPIRRGSSVEYHLTDLRLIEALDLLRTVLRDRLAYRASLMDVEEE